MEIEGLLGDNKVLLYFIGMFYIFINNSFDKKQKICMVYIFSYILKMFNILNVKVIIIILTIVSFIYIAFLSNDDYKNIILNNIYDKTKDYLYKIVFEYSGIYFLLSLIALSTTIQKYIPIIQKFDVFISIIETNINIISLIILYNALNNIVSQKYETNYFSTIKNKMDKAVVWTECKLQNNDREKLELLIDIEDKSYFVRDESYNFCSFEFIKYRINRQKIRRIKNKVAKKSAKEIWFKKIYFKDIIRFFKRSIRGYSTIEMQIIRTLGVKYGYEQHVICRKTYELLYSKMFFKSMRKHMNKSYLNTKGCCTYKEYLLMAYIKFAPIKINGKSYSNMLKLWNKEKLSQVSKEEFFISILGLSNRQINQNIIYNYYGTIIKHNLNEEKLETIIKKINEKIS